MTPLLAATQTTAYTLTPASTRLSPWMWSGFTTLNQIHGIWRWYRRYELYSKPDTLAQMLAGHALNFVLGDVVILRIAAQCLLAATRVMECAQQQSTLCNSARKWWVVGIQGRYPKPVKRKWEQDLKSEWTSPHLSGWMKWRVSVAYERVLRIIRCTTKVFFHCFKLSMRLMDVMDVFYLSPYSQNEGVTELFVNSVKCVETILQNKEELLWGLEANKTVIEKFLLHSWVTYDQIHSSVANTIEKTESVHNLAQTISETSGNVLTYTFNRLCTSSKAFIGL